MKIKAIRQELLFQATGLPIEDISCQDLPDDFCNNLDCKECPLFQDDYMGEEIEIEIPDSWVE